MGTGVVVTFAATSALRETLSVLLEHDCELRFLRPDAPVAGQCDAANLALLALPQPAPIVADLREHWPMLPIVAVDVSTTPASHSPGPHDQQVYRVPLEAHAIRTTVLQHLTPDRNATLRATVRVVAQTLRNDVSYSFAALRSFSALHAASAGPDTYALLGAVMREQSYVLAETVDQIQRFDARPRAVAISPEFPAALYRQLEGRDTLTGERGLLCECTVDAVCPEAGPLELAPAIAGFLRTHLRRAAAGPVVGVHLRREGVIVRYPRRPFATAKGSWPLLLAALALQPWSWSVSTHREDEEEFVRLRPAA